MSCIICLESDPAPVQMGCACRSDAGLAHVTCMVEKARWQHAQRGTAAWCSCQICGNLFTGAMRMGLADAWASQAEGAERISARANRGAALAACGNHAAAEPVLRQVLVETRGACGAAHPEALTAANNLGWALVGVHKYAAAERILRETLAVQRRVLGDEHPSNLKSASNLAGVLIRRGKSADAERILREVLSCMQRVFGEEHPNTLIAAGCLTTALLNQGTREKLEEAESIGDSMRAVQMRVLGPDHPDTLKTTHNLANALLLGRKLERAEALFRTLLDAQRRVYGDADQRASDTIDSLRVLARLKGP